MGIPSYKEIVNLVKTGLTIEAQEKIMELREAAMELQEENLTLREKVNQLEAQLNVSKNLKFVTDRYFMGKQDGTPDGPFCMTCYDKDGKLIRLKPGVFGIAGSFKWNCAVCNQCFP